MMKIERMVIYGAGLVLLVVGLMAAAMMPLQTLAAEIEGLDATPVMPPRPTALPPVMPPRPTQPAPSLPPRPEPSPTPPNPIAAPGDADTAGAQIELNIKFAAEQQARQWPAAWTVVQWQDRAGRWYDVEGWKGTPDGYSNGVAHKTWWVNQAYLGCGPFRWAVYQGRNGILLTVSAPFYLPRLAGQTERVEVLVAR